MSNSSQFQISPSRLLLLWLCMVYGLLAIVLLGFSEALIWPVKFFLVMVAGVAGVLQTRRYVWLEGNNAVVMLQYAQEEWTIHTSDGKSHQVKLTENSFVKPWLTLLHFKCQSSSRRYPVVLLPDSMHNSQFNSLLRLLKSQIGRWC